MDINTLSDKDKVVIAEYMHADLTDTLIKSEGQAVIDLFKKHNILSAHSLQLEQGAIRNFLMNQFTSKELQDILEQYTSGKLPI